MWVPSQRLGTSKPVIALVTGNAFMWAAASRGLTLRQSLVMWVPSQRLIYPNESKRLAIAPWRRQSQVSKLDEYSLSKDSEDS